MPKQNVEEDHTSMNIAYTVPKPKWNASGIANYQKQTSEKSKSLSYQFQQPEFIPVLCELSPKTLVISVEQNFEKRPQLNIIKNSKKNKKINSQYIVFLIFLTLNKNFGTKIFFA